MLINIAIIFALWSCDILALRKEAPCNPLTDEKCSPFNGTAQSFAPPEPKSVKLLASSDSSVMVNWSQPAGVKHKIMFYKLELQSRSNASDRLEETVVFGGTSQKFEGLTPYTRYAFKMKAHNGRSSEPSEPQEVCTFPGVPVVKPNVTVVNHTAHSIDFEVTVDFNLDVQSDPSFCPHVNADTWRLLRGPFAGFNLTVWTSGNILAHSANFSDSGPKLLYTVPKLKPYTDYNVNWHISNTLHRGPAASLVVKTLAALPAPPTAVEARNIRGSSFVLLWHPYDDAHGTYTGVKVLLYSCGFKKPERNVSLGAVRDYYVKSLLNATCYEIQLAIKNEVGLGPFSERKNITTDYNPPPPPSLSWARKKWSRASPKQPDEDEAELEEEEGLELAWLPWRDPELVPPGEQRASMLFQVCVLPRGVEGPGDDTISFFHNLNLEMQQLWSKPEQVDSDTMQPYQLMGGSRRPVCWDSSHWRVAEPTEEKLHHARLPWRLFEKTGDVVLELAVRSSSARHHLRGPGRLFSLFSNSTRVDLTDVPALAHLRRSQLKIPLLLIACAVVAVLLLIIITTAILVRRHTSYHMGYEPACRNEFMASGDGFTNGRRGLIMTRFQNSTHSAIPIAQLLATVARLHANDNAGFQAEFENLEKGVRTDWPASVAKSPDNAPKNRYSNVFAYDHTRVILREMGKCSKSNYINANYVDGYDRSNAYIAAQGPLPSTFGDFWQMVWEQNSNIIVMTSDFIERGRRKCDQYWPDEGTTTYGHITVRILTQHKMAFSTIRSFAIRHVKARKLVKDRIIHHYQYTDWPDFDVPRNALPVLVFVRHSMTHWRAQLGPVVVHCSAGVGRTGTFICIESLIRQAQAEQEVNIRGFLEHIRQQRMKLVQTEDQYAFIHDALCEYLLSPLHEVPVSQFHSYVDSLRHGHLAALASESSDCSYMVNQFQLCFSRLVKDYEYTSVKDPANADKNRSQMVVPLDSNRVTLPLDTWSDGNHGRCSNYINASRLFGYRRLNEFIATQHPLPTTQNDFWRMVWDQNSPLIICLTADRVAEDLEFWPTTAEAGLEIGWLRVTFICQVLVNSRMRRFEFLLSSTREDYALGCHLWQVTEWPDELGTASDDWSMDLLTLASKLVIPISSVVAAHGPGGGAGGGSVGGGISGANGGSGGNRHSVTDQQVNLFTSSLGPTVVIDEFGASRVGIFCALVVLINQILHDGMIDVYFVAKMFNLQRPNIWQSPMDLDHLYGLMEQFLRSLNKNEFPNLLPLPAMMEQHGPMVTQETTYENLLYMAGGPLGRQSMTHAPGVLAAEERSAGSRTPSPAEVSVQSYTGTSASVSPARSLVEEVQTIIM